MHFKPLVPLTLPFFGSCFSTLLHPVFPALLTCPFFPNFCSILFFLLPLHHIPHFTPSPALCVYPPTVPSLPSVISVILALPQHPLCFFHLLIPDVLSVFEFFLGNFILAFPTRAQTCSFSLWSESSYPLIHALMFMVSWVIFPRLTSSQRKSKEMEISKAIIVWSKLFFIFWNRRNGNKIRPSCYACKH